MSLILKALIYLVFLSTVDAVAIGALAKLELEYNEVPKSENLSLPAIDAVSELNIPYKILRAQTPTISGEIRYHYRIQFGKLNREQFTFLQATYDFSHSTSSYDSKKNYELQDFLPTSTKETVDKTHRRESGLPVANCYGTSYELARNGETYFLFGGKATKMLEILVDDRHSIGIESGKFEAFPRKSAAGDVLLFIHTGGTVPLQHAAVTIDRNWVFEKVDTGPLDGYRLVPTHDKSGKPYQYYDAVRSSLVFVRRFHGSGLEPLPHPAKVEGLLSGDGDVSIYDEFSVKGNQGECNANEIKLLNLP